MSNVLYTRDTSKKKEKWNNDRYKGISKSRTNKPTRCYYCKKEEHYRCDCPLLKDKSHNGEVSNNNSDINVVYESYENLEVLDRSSERSESE